MTETTTADESAAADSEPVDDAGDAAGEASGDVAASDGGDGTDEPRELAGGIEPEPPIKDRLLLPLLLPWLCIAAVALYALNVSRIFLAGDSTSALIIGTIITVSILAGAAIISASPRLRTSSLAMIMGFVLIIIVSGGLLSLGPSLNTGEGGGGGPLPQPKAAPASTVQVVALASIKFDSTQYTAKPGVVEIDYSGAPGHTLQFRTLDYQGFPLSSAGAPNKGKVELKAGTYNVYCTVDSHAQLGMVATITVAP
jgi:plastocyanin